MIKNIKIKAVAIKRFLRFYGITILAVLLLIFLLILHKTNYSITHAITFFKDIVYNIVTSPILYIIAIIPYLFFLLIKSLIVNYRQYKMVGLLKGVFFKIVVPIAILFIGNSLLQSYRLSEVVNYTWDTNIENNLTEINDYYTIDNKQRGIHVFHMNGNLGDIELLKTNNFEWITITPFIDQEDYNKPILRLISNESYTRRLTYYKKMQQECDKFGIKIMLKPHIWLSNLEDGKWRSDIEMETESDWNLWFENYSQIMLKYAKLAQELQLEQFCIGTELETTVYKKPEKWSVLIQQIKAIYTGKLTYAANWYHEYEKVPFWDQLDYIGIQAYFPLSASGNPTLEELENNWKKHIEAIALVHKKFNKPVLFTELGYKSIKGTSEKPWEWNSAKGLYSKISQKEQLLCYQSFFNTIWKEPWFHGIHIWEWQGHGVSDGANTNFTLEGKPALNLIAKYFKIEK